jgi:crossover junction endodeoxyribonuclease RusA
MISLEVTFPPTGNHMFSVFRGRKIMSKAYRAWREMAAVQIDNQMVGQKPIIGPYHLLVEFDRPDKRSRDLTNYIKPLEDSLVLCRVVRDDSDAVSVLLKWSDRPTGKGAVAKVEIESA